jgi:hypothetical protein
MEQDKCGQCRDFFPGLGQCGNPMVYLNHSDNVKMTTDDTKACGFFYPERKPCDLKK